MATHSFQLEAQTINAQAAGRFGGLSETFTIGGQSYTITHLFTHANGVQFRFSTNAQALAFIAAALTVDVGISGQDPFTTDLMDHRPAPFNWAQYQAYAGRFVGGTTYTISISDGVAEDYEGSLELTVSMEADAVVEAPPAPPAPVIPTGINLGRPAGANYIGSVSNVSALIAPRFVVNGATAYLRTFYLTPGGSFLVWIDSTSTGNGLAPGPEFIPAVETSPHAFILSAEGHGSISVPGPGIRGSGTPTGDHTEPYQYSPLNLASIRTWLGGVFNDAAAPDVYLEITDIGAGYVGTANLFVDFSADGTDLILTGYRTEDPITLDIEFSAVNTRFITYGYVGSVDVSIDFEASGEEFITYGYSGFLDLSVGISSAVSGFTSYTLGTGDNLDLSVDISGVDFTGYSLGIGTLPVSVEFLAADFTTYSLGTAELSLVVKLESDMFSADVLENMRGTIIDINIEIPDAVFSGREIFVDNPERFIIEESIPFFSAFDGTLAGTEGELDSIPAPDPSKPIPPEETHGSVPYVHIGERYRRDAGAASNVPNIAGYNHETYCVFTHSSTSILYLYLTGNDAMCSVDGVDIEIQDNSITVDGDILGETQLQQHTIIKYQRNKNIVLLDGLGKEYASIDAVAVTGSPIDIITHVTSTGGLSRAFNRLVYAESTGVRYVADDGTYDGIDIVYTSALRFGFKSLPVIPINAKVTRGRDSKRQLTPPRIPSMQCKVWDRRQDVPSQPLVYYTRPHNTGTAVSLIAMLSGGESSLMFTGVVDTVGYDYKEQLYTYTINALGMSSQLTQDHLYGPVLPAVGETVTVSDAIDEVMAAAEFTDYHITASEFPTQLSHWWLDGDAAWPTIQRLVNTEGPPSTFYETNEGFLQFRGTGREIDPKLLHTVGHIPTAARRDVPIPVIGNVVEKSENEFVVNHAEMDVIEYRECDDPDGDIWNRTSEFRILPDSQYTLTASFAGPVREFSDTDRPDFESTRSDEDTWVRFRQPNGLSATRAIMIFDNSGFNQIARVRNVRLQGCVLEIGSRVQVSSDGTDSEESTVQQSITDHGVREWPARVYSTISVEKATQLVQNIVLAYHEGVDTFVIRVYGNTLQNARDVLAFSEENTFQNPGSATSSDTVNTFIAGSPGDRAYMRTFQHVWDKGFYSCRLELESRSLAFFGVQPYIIAESTLAEINTPVSEIRTFAP